MNNARRKFKLGMHSYTLHLSGCGESWGFQSSGEIQAFERVLTLDKLMEFAVQEGIDVLHITLVDLSLIHIWQGHHQLRVHDGEQGAQDVAVGAALVLLAVLGDQSHH